MEKQKNMKNKKLCDWTKSGINKNEKLLFSLIKNPSFFCKKCARSSKDESYICKAEKIKE